MMTRGERVIAFIESFCPVPEGAKVGEPMVLAPFQKDFILAIYDNKHITLLAMLAIARKNGKTGLIAGILMAHIAGPEAVLNSQVVSGASSRDQAALVFALAAKMISLSPDLESLCKVVPSSKRILGLARNVEYRALSADGTTAHGLSPVLAILDEVGQIKGPTTPFIEAITTSQGAHDEPLLIMISTQAANDADFFSMQIDDAIKSKDPKIVCHVYEAKAGCALDDMDEVKRANPAMGLFRSKVDLVEQLKKAARLPSLENGARNLLMNQRISQNTLWLAPTPWKECSGPVDMDVFRSGTVALGLDLSMRNDLTAAVLASMDDNGKLLHIYPFVFTPEKGLAERSQRDRAPYDAWCRDGYMVAVPGPTISYKYVAEHLRDALDDLEIEVNVVAFDRWRIDLFKAACEEANFAQDAKWSEVGQGFRDMSPRIEAFEGQMLNATLRHGGHPLLNLAASNAIAVSDPAGSRKVDKSKSTQRIDPLIAALMATFEVTDGAGEDMSGDLTWMVG